MKKVQSVFAAFLLAAAVLSGIALCGCSGVESCPAAPQDSAPFLTEPNNWEGDVPQEVIDLIESTGHRVSRTSTFPSILHGQRYHMELDGDIQHAVSVYRYETAEAAAAEAACVGADGYSFAFPQNGDEVSIVEVSWTDTPHFYLHGDLIILYIGQDSALTGAFESTFGAPFAGPDASPAA